MRISILQHSLARLLIAGAASAAPMLSPAWALSHPRPAVAIEIASAGQPPGGVELAGAHFFAPEMSSYDLLLTGGALLLAARALRGRRVQR